MAIETNNYVNKRTFFYFAITIIIAVIILVILFVRYKIEVDEDIFELGRKEGALERHTLLLKGLNAGVILANPNNLDQYVNSTHYCEALK